MAKNKLTAKSLREQPVEDLELRLDETKREMFNLRLKATTKELTDPSGINKRRRDIARINTVIAEKRRQQTK